VPVSYDYKLQLFVGFTGCVAQTLVGIIWDVTFLMKLMPPHHLCLKNSEFHVQYTNINIQIENLLVVVYEHLKEPSDFVVTPEDTNCSLSN